MSFYLLRGRDFESQRLDFSYQIPSDFPNENREQSEEPARLVGTQKRCPRLESN